jgi:hypothetical protein
VAELVERRGLALVVDLRSGEEVRLEGPGPLVGRVEIRHRSVIPEEGQRTDIVVTDDVDYYLGYLRDRPDSIVGALEDIASGSGAVLVHCAAGKDRTGVVVALALAAAGVTREAIVADSVATHERVDAIIARLKASPTYAPDLEGVDPDSRAPRAETMHALLTALDDEHGGPLGWLRSHGFDPRALRARLHQREHPAR